ncbi:DUF4136 domain-containing protein [Mucilaginibacter sp. AW1-3]
MKKPIFLMMAVAIGFASCLKSPNLDELSTNFVVATNFDKTASFNSYKTYYVSDTIVNLGGSGADTILFNSDAAQLVNAVKTNMNARGYTFLKKTRVNHPDLGITIGVVKVTTTVFYPGWWNGYYGWWNPWYWGGYYPYYYPFATYYSYDTGSVIVDTYDLKNASANHKYTAVWNCVSFGVVGSSSASNTTRGVNGINQGYKQSPYFKAN